MRLNLGHLLQILCGARSVDFLRRLLEGLPGVRCKEDSTLVPSGVRQSFESWHMEVYKAAKLMGGYNADKAAVDAIITQTSSAKLQQRAIQENPTYEDVRSISLSIPNKVWFARSL